MIRIGPKYMKLKTDLQLTCKRLKMLQAKKMELSDKLRKEISNHLTKGNYMMAKIKTQTVIKYETTVEALEIVEMFCEQILEKYGLFEQMKQLDPDLIEPVSSLIWVSPYLRPEVPELKDIFKQLTMKYGSNYSKATLKNEQQTVNPELMERIKLFASSENKVQEYLRSIAKKYDVPEERKVSMEEYFSRSKSRNVIKKSHKFTETDDISIPLSSNCSVELEERSNLETFEGYGTVIPDTSLTCKKAFNELKLKKNRKPNNRWTRNFFRSNDLSEISEGNVEKQTENASHVSNEKVVENINLDYNTQHFNQFLNKSKHSYNSVSGKGRVFEISNNRYTNNAKCNEKVAFPATKTSSEFSILSHKKSDTFGEESLSKNETSDEENPVGIKNDSNSKTIKKTDKTSILFNKGNNNIEKSSSNNSDQDEPPPYEAVVPISKPQNFLNEHVYEIKIGVELECFPQYPTLPTCPALDDIMEINNDLKESVQDTVLKKDYSNIVFKKEK
ncbi:IST1 homolog [Nephila pilipes]|uniref:IST1 homolog n=1 Tax=Nephila pilipes TaxID=299642 RepID=A0A8X6MD24_NEPPI|nr:IST1 homolog [Nephila pilipes]